MLDRRQLLAGAAASVVAGLGAPALANEPPDDVILFEGKTREGAPLKIAMSEIRKLPRVSITTRTPWFDGETHFEGALARDVMAYVGAHGETLSIEALDGYSIKTPAADFRAFDPLFAYRADGKDLAVETKGPLMLVYPFDSHPEIANESYYARCIWQISKIDIE